MLNRDCKLINSDKKTKIIERSAKKGVILDEDKVNLLEFAEDFD